MFEQNHQSLLEELSQSALAANTRIAYDKAWNRFEQYCSGTGFVAREASPDTVANFLINIATHPNPTSGKVLSMSTISLYLAGINNRFTQLGDISPTQHPKVKTILRGLIRLRNEKSRRVNALRDRHIAQILSHCDLVGRIREKKLISLRDAALISTGFAAALRRSELCELKVEDIEFVNIDGSPCVDQVKCSYMFVNIRISKTDQLGKGHRIPVVDGKRILPVTRLRTWLSESNIKTGYLFQTMRRGGFLKGGPMHHSDIPRLVKHYANQIGLNPDEYAGHSLRSGFVTSAAIHNARLDKIMEITRHSNPSTVMKYIRDIDSFRDHAGLKFL